MGFPLLAAVVVVVVVAVKSQGKLEMVHAVIEGY